VSPRPDPSAPHTLIYPPIAAWNEQQGTARLLLTIGPDGWVLDATLLTSSGYAQLDAAALLTVGYWHYLPATKNGVPIAVRWRTELVFKMRPTTTEDQWQMRPEPPPPPFDSKILPDVINANKNSSFFVLYPQMARRNAQQGDVTLNILVRAEGYVSDAEVVKSSRFSQLDDAALVSVGYWLYIPAIKNGAPVDSWKTVAVHFALPDSDAQAPKNKFEPILPAIPGSDENGVSHAKPISPPVRLPD
jgi:TonB family protein